jgi:hypothetical protein
VNTVIFNDNKNSGESSENRGILAENRDIFITKKLG